MTSGQVQKIQKKHRREWNNRQAQRKGVMRDKSKFASKGGGLHNFRQRDARLQQEKQEELQRQEKLSRG